MSLFEPQSAVFYNASIDVLHTGTKQHVRVSFISKLNIPQLIVIISYN